MPDDLYWDDTLPWPDRQSALLRRVAAGEQVRDVDWEHVVEEIEDVGKRRNSWPPPVCRAARWGTC